MPKKNFSNVTTIRIERMNYEDGLTDSERNHYTETALDHYHNYDYELQNDGTLEDLKKTIETILERV